MLNEILNRDQRFEKLIDIRLQKDKDRLEAKRRLKSKFKEDGTDMGVRYSTKARLNCGENSAKLGFL